MTLGRTYLGPNLKYKEFLGESYEGIKINTGLDIPQKV